MVSQRVAYIRAPQRLLVIPCLQGINPCVNGGGGCCGSNISGSSVNCGGGGGSNSSSIGGRFDHTYWRRNTGHNTVYSPIRT